MAIAQLNKLKILIHTSRLNNLLEFLQEDGSVEVINLKSCLQEEAYSIFFKEPPQKEDVKAQGRSLEDILWLITFLSAADKPKRYMVKKEEFHSIAENFDYTPVFKNVKQIEYSLNRLEAHQKAFLEEKARLLPWQNLNVDLKDISKGAYTARGLGLIKKESLDDLNEKLKDEKLDVCIETIAAPGHRVSFLYVYLKEDEDRINPIFKKYEVEHIYFHEHKGTPKELLNLQEEKLHGLASERKALFAELIELSKYKKEAMILFDAMSNQAKIEDASKRLLMTEEVFLVEGWIKKSQNKTLKSRIEENFKEAEVFFQEPKPEDNVPVVLENKRFFQPFELITKIYGMPAYNEVDPTPFLAPFFFLFFGFCITDAAYGLILAVFAFFVLRKFKMGWMGNRFFRLLLYGGISTIILGAVTGGWFGNAIDMLAEKARVFEYIKRLKDSIVLLDPMKDPMKLLVIALSLGVIQIWFGHIVAIYGNVKNRRYLDALMDQGSTLLFLFGFTGVILLILNAAPKTMANIFNIALISGSLAITLTAGRANPTVASKLFYGGFALYNAFSGYLSDVLSYSRLWALGLVTGVMAQTSNMMAVILGNMVPFVGFIITLVILISGHTICLVMNLLGAFIHPLRLQFVEFFSKFFKGGGRSFEPLRLENKFTTIR